MPPDSHNYFKNRKPGINSTFRGSLKKLIFIFLAIFLWCLSLSECTEQPSKQHSLFDSLPLNGAFALDTPKNVDETQKLPEASTASHYSETVHEISNRKRSGDVDEDDKGASLFDLLPNQGAIIPSQSASSSQVAIRGSRADAVKNDTEKNPISNSRTQRHSNSNSNSNLYASLQPPATNSGVNNGHFEIAKQSPTSEFSFSVFDSEILPSIVKSLDQQQEFLPRVEYGLPTSSFHRAIPIIHSPTFNKIQQPPSSGGYNSNKGTTGPARPVIIRRPSSPGGGYNQDKITNAVRVPPAQESHGYSHYKKPSVGAAATSGGSTVIIYAHPQPTSSTAPDKEAGPPAPPQFLPRAPYGVPAKQTPYTTTTTTVSPVPKNEIHYHYHLNSNSNRENKPKDPSVVYGAPSGGPVPPPRSTYGVPNDKLPRPVTRENDREVEHGYRNYNYSPPSGSKGGNDNPGVGYSQSYRAGDRFDNSDVAQQSTVPVTGAGSEGISADEFRSFLSSSDDYTLDPNENNNNHHAQQNPQGNFKPRTLQSYNRGYQQNSPPQKSQPSSSYNAQPSTSYGPPSVYNPPGGYGPPSDGTSPPPPQEVNDPIPSFQAQNAQTSITLETIPITTTETRLVTVPKITQTLGNIQNIPLLSDTPLQSQPPSTAYGAPFRRAQPLSRGAPAPPGPDTHQNTRNIFNEQLLQLNPSRGGLSELSDIEALVHLQSQANSERNNNPFLSSLLLDQAGNSQFRGGSGDLFLNSQSPLRNSFLLNGPSSIGLRNIGGSGSLLGSIPSGGITVNNLPLLSNSGSPGSGSRGGFNNIGSSLRGGNTVLTGDAVGAISDLIREQRLQQAVSDLRNRLRFQNREADRSRQSYRSLFYKGALLLAGLSLIPTVASVASPLAAGAALGVGSSSALPFSSSLLPLTAGRRKRSIQSKFNLGDVDTNSWNDHFGKQISYAVKESREMTQGNPNKAQTHLLAFRAHNELLNSSNSIGHFLVNTNSDTLFDSMAFKGALIPEKMQADLEKYLPPSEVTTNSECIQKYFCTTLLEIEALPNPSSFLLLFAALTSDIDKNPWLKHALRAARNKSCSSFQCQI